MSFTIENDKHIIATSTPCNIIADDDKVTSEIWFRTPALTKAIIDKADQIQLETKSRDQGWVSFPEAGSWSWFDIVVLESPEAVEPKVKNGLAQVWLSHDNKLGESVDTEQQGPVWASDHAIFEGLEVGNSLAVRVCARFAGWENHASEGRLIIQVSERARPPNWHTSSSIAQVKYLERVTKQIVKLEESFDTYLEGVTPADAPPAYSLVRAMLPTGPLRADQSTIAEEPPLKLMSLDGGGVRGISSLHILQAILAKLSSDPNVKPCQYFDMIAGTSTGGLIAIMLGRLQMAIPECISAYETLSATIFSAGKIEKGLNLGLTGARYSKDRLEKGLKALIKNKTGDENAPMLDPDTNNHCKVFVAAGQRQDLNHTSAEHFRTYPTNFPNPFSGCTIWQAARATSAAPTYFPAIEINGVHFVDGGIRFNNPSFLLMGEVNAAFGKGFGLARRFGCFLSIGTGMQPNIAIKEPALIDLPYGKNLVDATMDVATDCETTHNLIKNVFDLFYNNQDVYFRFNAGVKVGDNWEPMIKLDDYKGMSELVKLTKAYVGGEAAKRIEECAAKLK